MMLPACMWSQGWALGIGCSLFLAIREMEIKATLQFHFTPVRMAKTDKITRHKSWWGCKEKEPLIHCWMGMQIGDQLGEPSKT